ncbi:DUF3014 domain-containing protein [Shewanella sp. 10N.286.48.B5]|uniref:DUF3014 domain-containing protein n=1 Tax=Shewanella sp. 10N.286.48.B5 TaxID=1880834 RepID=UPI000C83EFEB|nr:DUF3014 domain-containing protein [Shewanella sp. 10N.286.48.B5]PMH85486.1 hypothetical protein BCU57_02185 [Shewanella sp. 10N.286.48.B5]
MQVNQNDRATPHSSRASGSNAGVIGITIAVLLAGAGYFYFSADKAPEVEAPIPVQLPEPVPEQPIEQEPIEEEIVEVIEPTIIEAPEPEVVEPLPTLIESDDFVAQKTVEMADGMKIEPLLVKKDIARQFVVFVDNMAQGEVIRKASPLKGPKDKFTVSEITNKTYLNPDSYHRYDLYANMVSDMNDEQLINTYKELMPIFDEAFAELGYSDMSFDERMQQAFEMILSAPIIEDPIELSSISVNYQFVDPKLEALPNVQKFMVRMGPENSRKIKTAIRKLQQQMAN